MTMKRPYQIPKVPLMLVKSAAQISGKEATERIYEAAMADFISEYNEDLESKGHSFAARRLWFSSLSLVVVVSLHLFLRPAVKLFSRKTN